MCKLKSFAVIFLMFFISCSSDDALFEHQIIGKWYLTYSPQCGYERPPSLTFKRDQTVIVGSHQGDCVFLVEPKKYSIVGDTLTISDRKMQHIQSYKMRLEDRSSGNGLRLILEYEELTLQYVYKNKESNINILKSS